MIIINSGAICLCLPPLSQRQQTAESNQKALQSVLHTSRAPHNLKKESVLLPLNASNMIARQQSLSTAFEIRFLSFIWHSGYLGIGYGKRGLWGGKGVGAGETVRWRGGCSGTDCSGSRKVCSHYVIASPIHLRDAILALGTLQHPVALQVSARHQLVNCCIQPWSMICGSKGQLHHVVNKCGTPWSNV